MPPCELNIFCVFGYQHNLGREFVPIKCMHSYGGLGYCQFSSGGYVFSIYRLLLPSIVCLVLCLDLVLLCIT